MKTDLNRGWQTLFSAKLVEHLNKKDAPNAADFEDAVVVGARAVQKDLSVYLDPAALRGFDTDLLREQNVREAYVAGLEQAFESRIVGVTLAQAMRNAAQAFLGIAESATSANDASKTSSANEAGAPGEAGKKTLAAAEAPWLTRPASMYAGNQLPGGASLYTSNGMFRICYGAYTQGKSEVEASFDQGPTPRSIPGGKRLWATAVLSKLQVTQFRGYERIVYDDNEGRTFAQRKDSDRVEVFEGFRADLFPPSVLVPFKEAVENKPVAFRCNFDPSLAKEAESMTRGVSQSQSSSGMDAVSSMQAMMAAMSASSAARPAKNDQQGRVLERFTRDLTAEAAAGRLNKIVGREKEIDLAIEHLSNVTKGGACLVGEAGVGKSAVAKGFAARLAKGDVPERLRGKRLLELDLTAFTAGTALVGSMEERIVGLIKELKQDPTVILFIDEIHQIMGGSHKGGSGDLSQALKPALASGEIHILGATTLDEYSLHMDKDPAVARRFPRVMVDEPDKPTTLTTLRGVCDSLLTPQYKVTASNEMLELVYRRAVE